MAQPIQNHSGYHATLRPDGYRGKKLTRQFSAKKYGGWPQAQAACQAWIDSLGQGEVGPVVTIDRLFDGYLRQSEQRKKIATLRAERSRLRIWRSWLSGSGISFTDQIAEKHLDQFVRDFRAGATLGKTTPRGNRSQTLRKYFEVLRGVLDYGVTAGLLRHNVAAADRFRIPYTRASLSRIYSPSELDTIFTYLSAKPADESFFRFLAYTGCRLSEARLLTWSQVNFELGFVTFRQTKSGRDRTVPLHEDLVPYLQRLKHSGPHVFPRKSNAAWYHQWRRSLEVCQLAPGRIHDLRHTLGALMHLEGWDTRDIQVWLGHSTITMTEIYTKVFPAHLKRLSDRRHPLAESGHIAGQNLDTTPKKAEKRRGEISSKP